MNDRSEDMKRISQNLGRFVDFRYIAGITTQKVGREAQKDTFKSEGFCIKPLIT